MDERRHKHRDRYRRLHVDDHDHGGNDINDNDQPNHLVVQFFDDLIHGRLDDHPRHDDDRTRNEHDITTTDIDLNNLTVIFDFDTDYDDGILIAINVDDGPIYNDDPRYNRAVRAVYDAAARVLGTDAATDKPDDDAMRAYLLERARYDAGISDNATIFAPLRDAARTVVAGHGL